MAVEDKVKDIIVKLLGVNPEEITNEAKFQEDLGADSLDAAQLAMEFEQEFNIDIPEEDANQLTTVGQAVEYLTKRTAGSE
jgi:acyl carrier protein